MHFLYTEIKKRILIISITVVLTVFLLQITLNKIMLLLLNPLCVINIDIFNKITYNLINTSFEIFDIMTEQNKKTEIIRYTHKLDYLPSFEISIPVQKTQTIYLLLITWMLIYFIYPIVIYQIYLTMLPSLYRHEKKKYTKLILKLIIIWVSTILFTHLIYMPLYINYSYHNYQEYNYYEIDVDFNIEHYLKQYVKSIYINMITTHVTLLTINTNDRSKKHLIFLLIGIYEITQIPLLMSLNICSSELTKLKKLKCTYWNRLWKTRWHKKKSGVRNRPF